MWWKAPETIFRSVAQTPVARTPLLPEIGRDLSLSAGNLGLLMGGFGLGRIVADLPAGRLAGSGWSRRGLAAAGVSLAAASGLLAISESMAVALAASVVAGSASAVTNTLGMYSFAVSSSPERRGAAMAGYATALMAGLTVGPPSAACSRRRRLARGAGLGSVSWSSWRSAAWPRRSSRS